MTIILRLLLMTLIPLSRKVVVSEREGYLGKPVGSLAPYPMQHAHHSDASAPDASEKSHAWKHGIHVILD